MFSNISVENDLLVKKHATGVCKIYLSFFFFHASFISGSNVAFLNLFYVTFFKAVVVVESLGWLNFLIDVVIG